MSASSPHDRANIDRFEGLKDFGWNGIAWEFLRRDLTYVKRYRRVFKTKNEEFKLREEDVALEYGLKKLKDPREWCFEGEPPQFASLGMVRFRFNEKENGKAQKRTVRLAEGQVAVTFNLRSDVSMQLELAKKQLLAQQAKWVQCEDITDDIRKRLPALTTKAIPDYIGLVRALAMHEEGAHAADIGQQVLPDGARNEQKETGRQLVDRALAMRRGLYRLLILGALLEYDVPAARRAGLKKGGGARRARAK